MVTYYEETNTAEITTEENDRLDLDTTVVKSREDTYSSLTDINHIEVFSDKFQSKVSDYNQQVSYSNNSILNTVFTKDISNSGKEDKTIVSKLFAEVGEDIVKENYDDASGAKNYIYAGILIVLMIIVSLFMVKHHKSREGKEYVDDLNDMYRI